ncbi:MAG: hypothetical protein JO144_12600 [Actinobacteria bacterium]|nr:hypothetical protein [Actinomycetota bacterium]
MVLIGLILIAAAVAAAIILVVQNDGTITVHVFNSDYHMAAYWLAIAGLVIMAVLALGLTAVRAGAAHRMRLRRERRELLRENRRLSEQAATAPAAGRRGQTATAVDEGAHGQGAHAEPLRTRADEPGRTDV